MYATGHSFCLFTIESFHLEVIDKVKKVFVVPEYTPEKRDSPQLLIPGFIFIYHHHALLAAVVTKLRGGRRHRTSMHWKKFSAFEGLPL